MYHFAIIALMALALVKVVDFIVDQANGMDRLRSLLTFVGAVGAMWLLDYSVFDAWAVDVREHWIGVWGTGFMVAGATVPWRAVFGFLTHDRSTMDETLGSHQPILRKVS